MSFSRDFRQECIQGSAIDPALYEAAIDFVEDLGRWETYQELNWEIRTQWQTRKPHDFGVLAVFRNEDGSCWQAKPEFPPPFKDGKFPKYLAPAGNGARAFFPAVPVAIWERIADRYGVAIEGESFWDWIRHNPEIPIVITEGGKKALSLLSQGYVGIALYGVNGGHRLNEQIDGFPVPLASPELIEDLEKFAVPDRAVTFAFDQDEKDKTRWKVVAALRGLAELLVQAGCIVSIAQWGRSGGLCKGVDDLIACAGAEAWNLASDNAVPFAEWTKAPFQIRLPWRNRNERYLGPIELPQDGMLIVDSPMGTGKTQTLEDLLYQFFGRNPEGLADLVGYRNSLLKQTAQRINAKGRIIGVEHKHDMPIGWQGKLVPPSMAYCVNSLGERIDALNKAIDDDRKVLIGLDEVGFILRHLTDMMKSQPQTGLEFAHLMRRIGAGGGHVVAMQANIDQTSLDFLSELTGGCPVTAIKNQWKGNPWNVELVSPIGKNGKTSQKLSGIAAAQAAIEAIDAGKFPLLSSSGQEWLERLEHILAAKGKKMLRIDRDTLAAARKPHLPNLAATKEIQKAEKLNRQLTRMFMVDPDRAIKTAKEAGYVAIGFSPSAETGISIDSKPFDLAIDYAVCGTPESALQRLARDRNPDMPRKIFAWDRAADYRAEISPNADRLLKDWKLNAKQSYNFSKVAQALTEDELQAIGTQDELVELICKFAARYQSESNSSKKDLAANIRAALVTGGHTVNESALQIEQSFQGQWRQAKDEIERGKWQCFAQQPDINLLKALDILRSGEGTREQLFAARKAVLNDRYDNNLPLSDPDFVGKVVFDRRGAVLRELTQAWLLKNPAVAGEIDRASWKGQAQRGVIWAPAIKKEALKAQTLADTGILEILNLDEYSEDSPEVQRLRQYCIQNRWELRRVCGYASAFDEAHTGVQMVGWILARLQYKQKVARKVGARGEQKRFWKAIDECPYERSIVEAALGLKWENPEANQGKGSEIGSHDFSVPDLEQKIVTTGGISPGDLVRYGGDDWEIWGIGGGFIALRQGDRRISLEVAQLIGA